jgi:hypothetical protein
LCVVYYPGICQIKDQREQRSAGAAAAMPEPELLARGALF